MYCPYCGREVKGRFCTGCGRELQNSGKVDFVPEDDLFTVNVGEEFWDEKDVNDRTVVLEPLEELEDGWKRRGFYEDDQETVILPQVDPYEEEEFKAQSAAKAAESGRGEKHTVSKKNGSARDSKSKDGDKRKSKDQSLRNDKEKGERKYSKYGKDPYDDLDRQRPDEAEAGQSVKKKKAVEKPQTKEKKKEEKNEKKNEEQYMKEEKKVLPVLRFFSFLLHGALTGILCYRLRVNLDVLGDPLTAAADKNYTLIVYVILIGLLLLGGLLFMIRSLTKKKTIVRDVPNIRDTGRGIVGFVILGILAALSPILSESIPRDPDVFRAFLLFFQVLAEIKLVILIPCGAGILLCLIRMIVKR